MKNLDLRGLNFGGVQRQRRGSNTFFPLIENLGAELKRYICIKMDE